VTDFYGALVTGSCGGGESDSWIADISVMDSFSCSVGIGTSYV